MQVLINGIKKTMIYAGGPYSNCDHHRYHELNDNGQPVREHGFNFRLKKGMSVNGIKVLSDCEEQTKLFNQAISKLSPDEYDAILNNWNNPEITDTNLTLYV